MLRMTSGAITAPAARTTPKSATETPKKMNEPVAMRFRCPAIASAPDPSGRKSAYTRVSRSSSSATIEPVSSTL